MTFDVLLFFMMIQTINPSEDACRDSMANPGVPTTLEWYNSRAADFVNRTADKNHVADYDFVLGFLKAQENLSPDGKPRVLDIGCAQGRDIIGLRTRGAGEIVGLEPAGELARLAEQNSGARIINKRLEDLEVGSDVEPESFDLIWAMASLLHIKAADQVDVLRKAASLLRDGGVLFASYKVGSGERIDSRGDYHLLYFDVDEPEFRRLIAQVPELMIEDLRIQESESVPGLHWLRLVLRKTSES